MGTLKLLKKKSHNAEKGGLIVSKKVDTLCFGLLVKNLAHRHRFKHEPSALKSKHITARPRTLELCELRAETRAVVRQKSTRTFPKHLFIASVKSLSHRCLFSSSFNLLS